MMNNYRIRITLGALLLFYLASFAWYGRWNVNILSGGDAWGYNAYLPALFIHSDIATLDRTYQSRLRNFPLEGHGLEAPAEMDATVNTDRGTRVIKYTMGVAILQSPFFLLGHLTAGLLALPQDGYTWPYLFFSLFSGFFYVFAGLWLLAKALRRYFDEGLCILVLLTLGLATNLYFFTVFNAGMAHAYLFGLYAYLIFVTIRFYEGPSWKYAALIGLVAGMITLIRPVEAICLLIPLSFGIGRQSSRQERLAFLKRHWQMLLSAAGLFMLVGLPQLIYWKYVSGRWFYYSYGEEGFNFLQPHVLDGLLSYSNGWLVYTPVMVFALAGIPYLFRHRDWLWPVLLFLPLHIYISYSWWCWNYINGLGSRPMAEAYALLAFPLAYFFQVAARRKWRRLLLFGVLIVFSVLHLFQTYQHHHGVLWSEAANRPYFWAVFGKTSVSKAALIAFASNEKQPDTTSLRKIKTLYDNDFEGAGGQAFYTRPAHRGNYAYLVSAEQVRAPGFRAELAEIGAGRRDWLRVSVWCRKDVRELSWYTMPQLVVSFSREGRIRKHRELWLDTQIQNPRNNLWGGETGVWDQVIWWVEVAPHLSGAETVEVFVQNELGYPIRIDDLRVELWRGD